MKLDKLYQKGELVISNDDDNQSIKQKIYNEALSTILAKIRLEEEEISSQTLNAIVGFLKLDENTLRDSQSEVVQNFVKSIVNGTDKK